MDYSRENIIDALNTIDVSNLNYSEWVNVGMCLKKEGFGVETWDEWSKRDSRYKKGECQRKWNTFTGSGLTAGTIVQMAKDRGWKRTIDMTPLDWDATINMGLGLELPDKQTPAEQLIEYLETLFKKDEHVSYVTADVYQNEDGRWLPGKGFSDRTAGQLIAELKKHPNDIGAVIGDWKKPCGAWIRFNPTDGEGVRNENITRFYYALVECDTMPVSEQDAMYRKLELPIAALVYSGGKSLHAIVKVEAENYEDYRKRVEFLYDFLEKNGVMVDKQNRNPSRLSRMPGVTRGDNSQTLIATNIGRKSWSEWLDFVEGFDDELPELISFDKVYGNCPQPPEAVIENILRKGHKMLIAGPSKAGKSFALMELCIALAEGRKWLGFQCKQKKVLYVNLEIDSDSCLNRFQAIYNELKIKPSGTNNLMIWNLRGKASPLDKLAPKLIRRVNQDGQYSVIVIDPIYKVITGDENAASEMAHFCNQFDKICDETGCSVIYCHHHSKGTQGQKSMLDRASGSGVFARDPDAVLDLSEIEVPQIIRETYAPSEYATAWRIEGSLREFSPFRPFNAWFQFPIHCEDKTGALSELGVKGSYEANFQKNEDFSTPLSRETSLEMGYNACSFNGEVTVDDLADYLHLSTRTIRRYVDEFKSKFFIEKNIVKKVVFDK